MVQSCACIRIGSGRGFRHLYLPRLTLSHAYSFVSCFLFDRRGKVQEIENYLCPIIAKRVERGMDPENCDPESVSQCALRIFLLLIANVERYDHVAVAHCERG